MNASDRAPGTPDKEIIAAMAACVTHARDLLNSARAVQAVGHPNIAYHLATLALEEIGRHELIGVQSVARKATVPPAWPSKHTQDHVKKLFWCFFGGGFFSDQITAKYLIEMTGMARRIHDTRLLGLYVDHGENGLSVPSEFISKEESEKLIELAVARLGMAESQKFPEHIPPEWIEQQSWFLKATDDPETRRQIMSSTSLAKLAELKDTRAWFHWLKDQFATAEAQARAIAEQELCRSHNLPAEGSTDKWKLRVRILCASHSMRPKVLSAWNAKIDWIKLVPISSKKMNSSLSLFCATMYQLKPFGFSDGASHANLSWPSTSEPWGFGGGVCPSRSTAIMKVSKTLKIAASSPLSGIPA